MAQHKIRVGLIGAGGLGQGTGLGSVRWGGRIHGPIFQTLPETELVAVCTSRPETAQAAAQRFEVQHAFSDYREMVQLEELDLVSVVVQVRLHYPMVLAALEAGKHVLCEWPLAVTSEQAQELYRLAESKNLCHALVLQGRCSPEVMYLRDLVAQGYIGRPLAVNMSLFHNKGFHEKTSSTLYSEKKEFGGGALNIIMGHGLDAALWCLGDMESLCADVDTLLKEGTLVDTGEQIQVTSPDNVTLIGRLRNGAKITAQASWTADPRNWWQLYAYGTEGCLIANSNGNAHFSGITLRGGKRGDAAPQPLPTPAHYNWTPEFPESTDQFNVAQLVRLLAQGIIEDKEVRPNFLDAVRLHQLLEDIDASSQSRRWVEVAPGDPVSE